MLINWFTVAAQIVNFLVLVWLMKRFLYRPILDAINAREKRIAAELADAEAKQAEAQRERDEFRNKNMAFEQQRGGLLNQAVAEAKAERLRLLDEARRAADALGIKRRQTLQREQQRLNEELGRRTREEVFAIARKALTDLAGTSLEQCMGEVLVRRLQDLDQGARDELGRALKVTTEPLLVRSAFALPAAQRSAIQAALAGAFSRDINLRFETEPQLISGIELCANGSKVAWSITEYLAAMEKRVGELLTEQPRQRIEPVPGAAAAEHAE